MAFSRNIIRRRNPQKGFAMLAVVLIMLMVAVLALVATPDWVTARRRDREAEMIYRGETIALAIREFRAENNRYPTELKELMVVGPRQHRYLRQLYTEPLNPSGEWDLIPVGDPSTLPPGSPGAAGAILPTPFAEAPADDPFLPASDDATDVNGEPVRPPLDGRQPYRPFKINRCRAGQNKGISGLNGAPGVPGQPQPIGSPIGTIIGTPIGGPIRTAGPGTQIAGVASMVDEESIKSYEGKRRYCEWVFLANPPVTPGQQGQNPNAPPGQPGQPPRP